MPSRSKSTGFSIIEGLLTIALAVILGLSSWIVYQHVKTSATTTKAAPNPSNNQPAATTPAPTVAYLDIKEWGVRLPLSDAIKDAYYVPSNQNHASSGTPLTMWIGLKSLDGTSCDAKLGNAPSTETTGLGTLIRVNPTDQDPVSAKLYVDEYPNTIIGKYAYVYSDTTKGSTCAPTATLQSTAAAFNAAAKSTSTATTTTN